MSRWLRRRGVGPGSLWKPRRESQDAYSHVRSTLHRRSRGEVSAHMLRRRFCIRWLLAGGSEVSLQRLLGWSDNTMVRTYSRAAADEISHDEYKRLLG